MKIGELAEKCGLSITTLRFYEQKGLFGDGLVKRAGNNYRDYGDRILEILDVIKKAQTAGFTLEEIGSLLGRYKELGPDSPEIINALEEKLAEIDQRIADISAIRNIVSEKLKRRKKTVGTQ